MSACNSEPTLVIKSAGRNNLTHVLEMSLEDDSFKRLNLDATAPYPIVSNTARDACRAPRKLVKIPCDIVLLNAVEESNCKV